MPSEKSAVRTTVSPTTEAAEHLSSEKCTEATDTKSVSISVVVEAEKF